MHRVSVCLAIEKIAPAADGLPQDHQRRGHVKQRQAGYAPPPGQQIQPQRAADDPAVYRQSALPEIQDADGVLRIVIPPENHIVQPRAYHAQGHGPQRHVQPDILRQSAPPPFALAQDHRAQHGQGNQHAVD